MRCRVAVVVSLLLVAGGVAEAQTQDVGHKTLGTLGLDAGTMAPTGLYALDVVAAYHTTELFDKNGNELPVGLQGTAFVNTFGVAGSYEVPRLHTWVGAAFSAPVARVQVSSDDPRASLDNFGFGDLYVQPVRLGWRPWGQDLVVGYGFYAPTGSLAPGGRSGIGSAQWTQQLSWGGTFYFDRARRFRLSALASYEVPSRKVNREVWRGSTVQIQGGIGARFQKMYDVGVAGYGLWQVSPNSGSDLPTVLLAARDLDYGLGPELGVTVKQLRLRVTARYTHDVYVRSRPLGSLVFLAISVIAWQPSSNGPNQ